MVGISSKVTVVLAFAASFLSTSYHLNAQDDNRLKFLMHEFWDALEAESYDRSKSAADAIFALGELKDDNNVRMRGLVRLAFIEMHFGRWGVGYEKKISTCKEYFMKAPTRVRAEYFMFRGKMLGTWQDDIDGGMEILQDSIWMSEQIEEDETLAWGLTYLSQLCSYRGDEKRMLDCAYRAVLVAKYTKNQPTIAHALEQLINAHDMLGEYDRALELSRELLEIKPGSRLARWNLCRAGEDQEFFESFQDEITELNKQDLSPAVAATLASRHYHLGLVYESQEKPDKAVEHFLLAAPLFKKAQNDICGGAIAEAIREIEIRYSDDLPTLATLIEKAKEDGSIEKNPNLQLAIARGFESNDQHKEALKWFRTYLESIEQRESEKYRYASSAAEDYWETELKAREQRLMIGEQRSKSQFAYLVLICVSVGALGLIGIALTWLRASRIQAKRLAKLVDERTASLRDANKQANEANMAKGEFLARVNHEIRNPLAAILGYCELLQINRQSANQDLVFGLENSSKHLLDLVDDVLIVSRIENGEVETEEHEFTLAATLDQIYQMSRESAQEKGLSFHCTLEPNRDWKLVGDETKLRQIVLNLVSNAIKYSDEGHVEVRFQVSEQGSESVELGIRVSDNGCGISEEDLSSVFEQFSRSSHDRPGTGLGLYICRKLAALLGGSIDVQSRPGNTVFEVKLPFQRSRLRQANQGFYDNTELGGVPKRVLVIDDQSSIRQTLTLQLESIGFEAHAFEDIDKSIECIETFAPSVVLLDLRMPKQDGFAVLSMIRNSANGDVPVIAMTGDATDQVRTRCYESGFDGFITKPFRLPVLRDAIEMACDDSSKDSPAFSDGH